MWRLGLLGLLLALVAACGGGARAPAAAGRQVVLRPGEHRIFRAGALQPGDLLTCDVHGHRLEVRVPDHAEAKSFVGKGIATPAGARAALTLTSGARADGSITASCRSGKS